MKKILFSLLAATTLVACQKTDTNKVFDESVTQRTENQKKELLQELTSAEQGWKLVYQPNSKKYGGFTFVMKFNKDGNVVMTSDAPDGVEPETGLYQIVTRQTTTLSFLTKNHIHRLADAAVRTGRLGVGYEGEFDFLYLGKEDEKLKFKTQRSENTIYFEKATQEDWGKLSAFSENFENVLRDAYWYFFRLTTSDGTQTDYIVDVAQRYLTIKNPKNPSEKFSTGLIPTEEGFKLNPALELQGTKFTKLVFNPENRNYTAVEEGVKAELIFTTEKQESILTDDYKDISKIGSLIFFTRYLANESVTSPSFRVLLKPKGNFKVFNRITFSHYSQYKLWLAVVEYGDQNISAIFRYDIQKKRMYLTRAASFYEKSDPTFWDAPENKPLLDKALEIFDAFGQVGEEVSYLIEKRSEQIQVPNTIYVLRKEKNPEFYVPFYSIYN